MQDFLPSMNEGNVGSTEAEYNLRTHLKGLGTQVINVGEKTGYNGPV